MYLQTNVEDNNYYEAYTSPARTTTTKTSSTSTTTTTTSQTPLPTTCNAAQRTYCNDNPGPDRDTCRCDIAADTGTPVCYGVAGCPSSASIDNPACSTDQDCGSDQRCLMTDPVAGCPGGRRCASLSTCGQDFPASLKRGLEMVFEKEERRREVSRK